MSAKKNPVTTPLHLLQQLSHSLLEHLENACSAALVDVMPGRSVDVVLYW